MDPIDLCFMYSLISQGAVFGDKEIPPPLEAKEIRNLREDWSSAEKVAVHEELA
jgi:hypothetical protein